MSKLSFIFLILSCSIAKAYPEFIGYGYTTCIVCHYNSQGGGPLTDYGRALFAQEIAARPFIPAEVTDDDLADHSGFIPGREMPYWIRPSLKYRGLWLETDPHGSKTIDRWINMQTDASVVFSFDPKQKTIVSLTYGLLPERTNYYSDGRDYIAVSREHYVRFYATDSVLVAIGLMDKVYGIRTVDHTALSREALGLGENDAVDGVHVEWSTSKWDVNLHAFVGDQMKAVPAQQRGFSWLIENEVAEKNRLGTSYIVFETAKLLAQRLAVHDRWGLPDLFGTSLLGEFGYKRDTDHVTLLNKDGFYALVESLVRLTRGYSVLATAEYLQNAWEPTSTDEQKYSLGLLTFPFQRTEVRAGVVKTQGMASDSAIPNQWSLQAQLHLSL